MIREHTEKIKPPRALWVSFDLGRPLGVPNNPKFQISVLKHALNLLETAARPVLEDFPGDAPDTSEIPLQIACPVNFRSRTGQISSIGKMFDDFSDEVIQMRTWYDLAVEKRQRTTTGVSGLSPEEASEYLSAFAKGEPAEIKMKNSSMADSIRMATEDLKAYYFEAVTAQPGQPTDSTSLANWFWGETVAATVINHLRQMCLESGDNELEMLGKFILVPRSQAYRFKE